jgi:arylformamidase
MQQEANLFAVNSENARARLGAPRRFSYGPTPIESLDVYATNRENAPINVFIHGGAWQGGAAKDHAFPAELFVRAGAHYVVLDSINVLDAGGSLIPMVEQVRRAIAWIYQNARAFGGDPARLYISGQSSGAHLASVALTTNWESFGVPANPIKGALCVSGMYDLRPVRLSARSNYVTFTDEVEERFSAQRHVGSLSCPLVVAHGTLETPEFQRQARDFVAAVRGEGKSAELLIGEGYNHFELLETLANPYDVLGHAVLQQMALI